MGWEQSTGGVFLNYAAPSLHGKRQKAIWEQISGLQGLLGACGFLTTLSWSVGKEIREAHRLKCFQKHLEGLPLINTGLRSLPEIRPCLSSPWADAG